MLVAKFKRQSSAEDENNGKSLALHGLLHRITWPVL